MTKRAPFSIYTSLAHSILHLYLHHTHHAHTHIPPLLDWLLLFAVFPHSFPLSSVFFFHKLPAPDCSLLSACSRSLSLVSDLTPPHTKGRNGQQQCDLTKMEPLDHGGYF